MSKIRGNAPGSGMKRAKQKADVSLKRKFPHLRRALLAWFDENKRDYPWRRTGNWFHLLMAEMMLRRTRADQALQVYSAFTAKFSRPEEAAGMIPRSLEKMLRPLGLAWRARQIRSTLHYLRDHYGARAPEPEDDLSRIPGVGDYSEAMLRNRLFGEARAAIDVNVARVIRRWQGREAHAESRREADLRALADSFVRAERSWELNLALLDLAALVCKARTPLCAECPLQSRCLRGKSRAH